MKIDHEKIKKGDKILVWATVTSVLRSEPCCRCNDVSIKVENGISDPSTMSVELKHCDIEKYIYKQTVFEKVADFVKKNMRLNKKELELVSDSLQK